MNDPLEVPVQKLGHPVFEVRTWAFFSLVSKLECDIISLEQLTENELIIGKLVHWMKHDKCSQQEKILELIYNLVQYSNKNIERLLSFDSELLCLKRLHKVEQHQQIITDILNRISQSGIKNDVSAESVLELHWTETNRPEFESLFSTFRLTLDSLADPDIHLLTQWELAFDSEDGNVEQNATADFTSHLIQDFHVQSFLQHSNFMKIILKKLNDVSSINTVKQVLGCLNVCVLDIQEQIRSKPFLVPSQNNNLIYCRVTIPFFYLSLLDSLLPHVKLAAKLCLRIIRSLASCIKSVEALWSSGSRIGSQFCSSLMSTLRALCEKSNECRDPFTKVQLFLLISSTIQTLLPRVGLASHLPATIQTWMCTQVTRPDLYYLYPSLSQPWYELCAREFPENKELGAFKSVLHIKSCLTSTLDCIHHADSMSASQSIQCLFDSLPSLYYHRDSSLVRVFINVCSQHTIEDPDDLVRARHILISLLSCSDAPMQLETYAALDQCVHGILRNEPPGSASNESQYRNPTDGASSSDSNGSSTLETCSRGDPSGCASFNPAKRLRFMLDTEVLIELLCQGARSASEQIRSHARNILQSLLSARVSVTMATWTSLLGALSPVLCLLQCMVPSDGASEALGAEIIQLTHPDLAKDIRVSKLQTVKCNACLLYHKSSTVRLEAAARLAWTTQYAGAVTSTLADLCVTGCTRSSLLVDVYEESSVTRVLELLTLSSRGSSSSAPDEETRVRFSCLTQLSVMMDDVKLHRAFLDNGGVTCVMQELHQLLNSTLPDWTTRKQSIGCCVRILRSACENNSSVRQYLSSEYSLVVDVIKVLLQFDSCHSDSVQLLFVLLYADFVLNSEEGGSVVSVPAVLRANLHVPDPYSGSHWDTSPHSLPDDTELLLSDAQCKQHLSIHWTLQHLYAGDIHKMLRDELPDTFQTNNTTSQVKNSTRQTPPGLAISKDEWKLLRRASIVQSCSTSLQVLQSTSSYSEAYTAVSTLQRYLDLQHIESSAQLDKLPFSSVLYRYLEPAPSSVQDQQLLLLVLKLVQTLPESQLEWVSTLLVSKQTLLSLIQPHSNNLTHHSLLCIRLLNVVRNIIVTHPTCVHAYGSLTQSVLRCIEQHSQLDSPMLAACLNYLCDVLHRTEDTKGVDTECLWHLLAAVPVESTRLRSDLACKVLMCLDLAWSSKLNNSVAMGVWLSEVKFPVLDACLSSRVRGSVKCAAYHLLSGLCYTRGSVSSVVHNMPSLVDGALQDVLAGEGCDLVVASAARVCANITSFSTCEILLEKCIGEDFFARVMPILSNPRSSRLKSAVCSLVNNLFNLNPGLLANTDAMVHLISVLISELINNCSSILTCDVTEYCTAIVRILTQYYSLNPEVPTLSDRFHASLIYMLNASSYDRDISSSVRDTLWQCTLSLLSSLPLPPPLPPTVASTLCYSLKTHNPKTARSILATLPRLVPHLIPDNLEALCHVVFSAWSRRFKPCPVVLNAVLALTAGHRNRDPSHGPLLVLKYDLLEDVHDRLKQFYVSLECSHGDSLLCTEMDIYLQLLNNILAQSSRVAEVAAKSGLADTLHKLLGWVQSSETTLACLLQVITTFTAHCVPACTSCVHTSTLLGSGLSKSTSSSSLVHSLISLVVMSSTHNPEVRIKTLGILAHLVLSNECRLIVSKSSLFDHFTDALLNKKLSPPLETAWIQFLKAYSLHLSQYNNTVDNVHFIDTLVERTYRNVHYLIVLTNLTFHAVYHTKLSGHSKFLKLVQDILASSELVSLNKCARTIRTKLNAEIDGGNEDIRSINEKLFHKYFHLLLFDKTLHRGRRLKSSRPDRNTNERDSKRSNRYSQRSDGKSDEKDSSDAGRTGNAKSRFSTTDNVRDESHGTDNLDEKMRDTHDRYYDEKENIPQKTNERTESAGYSTKRTGESSQKLEHSKRKSYESYRSRESERCAHGESESFESFRNRESIGSSESQRVSTLEKYAKLVKNNSSVSSQTVLGQIETHATHGNAVTNEIATILDMAQAFDTVLTEELNRVIKRNAALIVWNLSANNYKMKLHFKHVGLVNSLQSAMKCDVDFTEEYVYVIDMLLS